MKRVTASAVTLFALQKRCDTSLLLESGSTNGKVRRRLAFCGAPGLKTFFLRQAEKALMRLFTLPNLSFWRKDL